MTHAFGRKLGAVRDQKARNPDLLADLAQAVGVRAVLGADHQQHIDVVAELAHRRLAVLRSIADVAGVRADNVIEPALQRRDDRTRVVDAQRRLRDVGDRLVGVEVELLDVAFVLHQEHRPRNLAHRAFDLRVAGVPDQDQRAPLRDVALALVMHLGDQRTRRIEYRQIAPGGLALDLFRHAVGAEHRHRSRRNLLEAFDESRALRLQALVADIDRRTVLFERAFDDLDRAHDAGAKSARLGENDAHSPTCCPRTRRAPADGWPRRRRPRVPTSPSR